MNLKMESVKFVAIPGPIRYPWEREGNMSIIDAHCHLTDERVWKDADAVIRRALAAGVRTLMMGGVDSADWTRQLQIQMQIQIEFPEALRTSFGLHPWRVEALGREGCMQELTALEGLLPNADALGETGLDFHPKRDSAFFDLQCEMFRRQVRLAQRIRKPLVLHVVSAHDAAVRILEAEGFEGAVLLHSFSGSAQEARRWCQRGAVLSFSGTILRPGNRKVKEALLRTPLDRMVFETDYPDQSWGAFINEPRLVMDVYRGASDLLGVSLEVLIEKTNANFAKIR